ncbi:exonuclease [Alteromonas phage vB_AmeP_PT11-V19]|nr:exonuclease [Alteromonas phage vB_AmeP_PT11-V19]
MLVSALPAVGKTSLLQSLEDVVVIARDGKKYPFPQPHVNVPDFETVDEFIATVVETVEKYEEKFGNLPKTLAFDSFSKVVLDIEGNVLSRVSSFPYAVVNTEIKKLVDFIENDVASNFDVVIVSHANFNEETTGYQLVNAGGSWGKKGGILSEVDESLFIEMKGKKRILHYRNPKMIARTTVADLPDSEELTDEFSLQKHLEMLRSKQSEAAEWSL